jgi:hypothetical protein
VKIQITKYKGTGINIVLKKRGFSFLLDVVILVDSIRIFPKNDR